MDDQALMTALRERREGAAETLLRQYGALVRYVASGILSDRRETEECVNDVCLAVWQKIGQYDPEKASLSAWITAIARNAAISRARAGAKYTLAQEQFPDPGETASPEAELLKKERAQALRSAVARLSERDRALFYRKYYYCQSTEKMAAELGLTPRAVEGRLYRLRAKLRDLLGGDAL